MLAAQTELKNAEKVRGFLIKHDLFHSDYLPIKELGLIYFPLKKKINLPLGKVVNTKFSFPKKEILLTIEGLLKGKLTAKQLGLIPRSQEIVGKIMILEVPEQLEKKEKLIAEAYLKINKNIETVVKKSKIHHGEFRLRGVKILAGKKSKETIHQENGIRIKLHLEKTYFSARSGHERLRIAQQVKKGEEVLVMFSGAGPYPLVIAKNSSAKKVYGIEINPLAHQYALESVKMNKLEDKIVIIQGDVRDILPSMKRKFDRIAMPLPKTGEQFLPLALKKIQKKGIIHLYDFLSEEEIAVQMEEIKNISKQEKHKIKILRAVKCGQFSPHVYRICFDILRVK